MIYTIPPPGERRRSGVICREPGDTQKVDAALKAFQLKGQDNAPQAFILKPWVLFLAMEVPILFLFHLD
jgi:hypothetical protein